jgi:outer membrane protein assembly factor BamE (lipoprotein component of BamABCDE complex)
MRFYALAALTIAAALAGCSNMTLSGSSSGSTDAASTSAAKPKTPPGMNDKGEVVDSKKVEAGHGTKVKGINDWEGEITGKPAKGSKFTQLKIGMSLQQTQKILGEPDDEGAYMTGKAWIPFNFGSDRSRVERVYKGQGRLIFATGAGMTYGGSAHLIWIIHNANEVDHR